MLYSMLTNVSEMISIVLKTAGQRGVMHATCVQVFTACNMFLCQEHKSCPHHSVAYELRYISKVIFVLFVSV